MSILKALQRKRTEGSDGIIKRPAENIVPFDRSTRRANTPPDLLTSSDLRIGTVLLQKSPIELQGILQQITPDLFHFWSGS